MKIAKIVSLLVLLYFISSCQKDPLQGVKVVKHCTGTYLEIEEEHYLVCNKEVVDNYEDGTCVTAEVDYITWDECNNTWAACYMEYPHEGVIQVKSIAQN